MKENSVVIVEIVILLLISSIVSLVIPAIIYVQKMYMYEFCNIWIQHVDIVTASGKHLPSLLFTFFNPV